MKRLTALALAIAMTMGVLVAFPSAAGAAPSLSVTPATVSKTGATSVHVTAAGLTAGGSYQLEQCAIVFALDNTIDSDCVDKGTAAADPTGALTADVSVAYHLNRLDCIQDIHPPAPARDLGCIVRIRPVGGAVLTSFTVTFVDGTPNPPPTDPRRLGVTPSGLPDDRPSAATISGTAFTPGASVQLSFCENPAVVTSHAPLCKTLATVVAAGDGSLQLVTTLRSDQSADGGGTMSCVGGCFVRASEPGGSAATLVQFQCTSYEPTAVVTVSPDSGAPPLVVTVDASRSYSGETCPAGIASYTINFGDGTTVGPQSESTASHTFTTPGSYPVTITLTDANGQRTAATHTVTISSNDQDHDGIVDGADNCPAIANAGQADADHDGIGDVCDPTPLPPPPPPDPDPSPVTHCKPVEADYRATLGPGGDLFESDLSTVMCWNGTDASLAGPVHIVDDVLTPPLLAALGTGIDLSAEHHAGSGTTQVQRLGHVLEVTGTDRFDVCGTLIPGGAALRGAATRLLNLVEHLPAFARRAIIRRLVTVLYSSRQLVVDLVARLSRNRYLTDFVAQIFDQVIGKIQNFTGGHLDLRACVPAWQPTITMTLSPNGSATAVLNNFGTAFTTYQSGTIGLTG